MPPKTVKAEKPVVDKAAEKAAQREVKRAEKMASRKLMKEQLTGHLATMTAMLEKTKADTATKIEEYALGEAERKKQMDDMKEMFEIVRNISIEPVEITE